MPWYTGRPLLDHLEAVHIASDINLIDFRFPVQHVLRPNLDFRGYAGTISSGVVRRGDDVVVLPSGRRSKVAGVFVAGSERDEAHAPMAVTLTLEGETDVSRGDVIVRPDNVPQLGHSLEAMVVWMHEQPLEEGREYLIKQATVLTSARMSRLRYRVNVNTIHREKADRLGLNEIGRVTIETPRLIAYDAYARNRWTGSFILIDRISNATLGAGMIVDLESIDTISTRRVAPDAGTNLRASKRGLDPGLRAERLRQQPSVVWLTGLPRSGKSSLAYALERRLFEEGFLPYVIDGEGLRQGLSADLGFSRADRKENARRAAELARTVNDLGAIAVVALVSPFAEDRAEARRLIGHDRFLEIYCNAPLELCESRDAERLFDRARSGEVANVTGIDLPYEPPSAPDLQALVSEGAVDEYVEQIVRMMRDRGWLTRSQELSS
jgi:bifunctional enzyme CysN/CysC